MLAKVNSCAVVGLDGAIVEVEVDIASGLPAFTIVGLPDTAVQEAKERVRSAIRNSGLHFPQKRITVNLAPADLRKEGPAYDLPIAVGIVLASEQASADVSRSLFLGELSLDGLVRHARGILSMVALAREKACEQVFVPEADLGEATLIGGMNVLPVASLTQLVSHLRGDGAIAPVRSEGPPEQAPELPWEGVDFSHIKGQEHVKRALEVAAAGGHNVLMTGPPGSGKTLLARSLPSIMPALAPEEALEVTKIYSVAGLLRGRHAPGQAEAVPVAPSHHLPRRARGRRPAAAPGRDQPQPPRRSLSRRAAGVRTGGAGGAAPAHGGPGGDHQPGPGLRYLPGELHAGGGHEPLPVLDRGTAGKRYSILILSVLRPSS